MPLRTLFTESDRQRIAEAVRAAEERTRGEIVATVTAASDDYDGAAWQGAAFGALALPLLVVLVDWVAGLWSEPSSWFLLAAGAAGCAAGFAAVRSSALLTRWLVADEDLDRRVARAASAAFVEHEVFATRDRSGVLMFLSLLERRVVVLGDSGIDARVRPGEWDEIVELIVRGMREGRPADALIEGIERCGELLERPGLERRPDDRDELGDALRVDGPKGDREGGR